MLESAFTSPETIESGMLVTCCMLETAVPTTTAYKWWNCQVFRPANCCQLILPNRFLDGFPDPSQFAAAKLTHYSSKAATTLGLLTIMATHPALRRCTPEPWSYYKVSLSGVCTQCYKSWGELFMQSLFWMGTFEVFWSSKRSRV